ncbi:MAG: phosphate acyltransferase PlsX [Nevskiales bacterium]|nr:phosphate acyltransferase PlsX [Nevskiales bacterium]
MTGPVSLAIDAMSGDHGQTVAVGAVRLALQQHPELRLILVGDASRIEAELATHKLTGDAHVSVQHASEVVEMTEPPARVLRNKKDSSMRVALNLVRDGRAQACVSAGNTGALMGLARLVLGMLPGIDRPAIISAMPNVRGHAHMLDLGANATCTAEQLFQFAVMGAALATAVDGIKRPRVALLNIGQEDTKGHHTIRDAAARLSASDLNYIGFIEGDGIFFDPVDVVVCDGFVGNVALKTGEGVARLIRRFMREEFTRNLWHRLTAATAYPVLKSLSKRLDSRNYNGASFLGLNGIVIKSHGDADARAFANAIRVAALEVKKNVPRRIGARLAATLGLSAVSRLATGGA